MTKYVSALLAPLVLGMALAIAPAAMASPQSENFVQTEANRALSILSDAKLTEAARTAQFGQFVDEVTNERLIARFVLGKYARGLDKDEFAAFRSAFTAWAKSIYQGQLAKYGGETITVNGSIDRNDHDSVVETTISGGALEKPLKVSWRVITKDDQPKIVDLEAFGVWLAIQQRSEITAYIANHGGSVAAATQMLQSRVTQKTAAE